MAYDRKEYINLLKEIGMSGTPTPRMLELLQKLRDDFDEREGLLRRYQETRDKDIPSGYKQEEKKIRTESKEDDIQDGGERGRAYGVNPGADRETKQDAKGIPDDMVPREEYDKLKRDYIDRFFSSPELAKRDQEEDVRKDDEVKDLDFEDLFRDREG